MLNEANTTIKHPVQMKKHSLKLVKGLRNFEKSGYSLLLSFYLNRLDVVYCGEENDICTVEFRGEERQYRRLHVLEFDSDRKRMSVIIQCPDGSIWLLCKGAESSILPRCVEGPLAETENHIKDYAMVSKCS